MEDLSKILHNLDQGNTSVTEAKELVLDLFNNSDKLRSSELASVATSMMLNVPSCQYMHNPLSTGRECLSCGQNESFHVKQ